MSRGTVFLTRLHVFQAKTPISLRIQSLIRVFAGHSIDSQGSGASSGSGEDFGQTARMPRLIEGLLGAHGTLKEMLCPGSAHILLGNKRVYITLTHLLIYAE